MYKSLFSDGEIVDGIMESIRLGSYEKHDKMVKDRYLGHYTTLTPEEYDRLYADFHERKICSYGLGEYIEWYIRSKEALEDKAGIAEMVKQIRRSYPTDDESALYVLNHNYLQLHYFLQYTTMPE